MNRIDIIKDEIDNDPLTRGYAGMTDEEVADDMNTEYRSRNLTSMTSTQVFNAVNVAEFQALADGQQNTVMQIMGFGEINPFGREADVFIAIFGAGSDTIAALAAARVVPISRGDELEVGVVKAGHVQEARR